MTVTQHLSDQINWADIETRWGPIDVDRRALLEMQALAFDSQRLLTQADSVERWGRGTRDDIAAAHAAGLSLQDYYLSMQSDDGDDW